MADQRVLVHRIPERRKFIYQTLVEMLLYLATSAAATVKALLRTPTVKKSTFARIAMPSGNRPCMKRLVWDLGLNRKGVGSTHCPANILLERCTGGASDMDLTVVNGGDHELACECVCKLGKGVEIL